MTLLFDRLRADPIWQGEFSQGEEVLEAFREWVVGRVPPVYDITNVAQYLADSGTEFSEMEHFPNVAPPHDFYWMEWRAPERLVPLLDERDHIGPERVGLVVWQNDGSPIDGTWDVICHSWGIWKRHHQVEPLVEWRILMHQDGYPEVVDTHIVTDIAKLFGPGPGVTAEVEPIDLPVLTSEEHGRQVIAELKRRRQELDRERAEIDRGMDEAWSTWVRYAILHPALMAHSLLACRNVSVDSNRPPERLSRRHKQKTGRPLVTFKTLRVSPVGGHRDAEHSGGGAGIPSALHIVRGHFKTFTEERPLFGRLTGTYWWSSTLRGSAEHGVVVKEYDIRARGRA